MVFMRSNEIYRGGERYVKDGGDQDAGVADGEESPGAEAVATSDFISLEI